MQKIFTFLFFIVVLMAGVPTVSYGAESQSDITSVVHQLEAIKRYLTRIDSRTFAVPLTVDEQRDILHASAEWFTNVQEPNGHFRYEYIPYSDELVHDDNIVRQAGSLYALGEIARRDVNNQTKTGETAENSIAYFEHLSKEDTFDGTTFRCIATSESSTRCQLGATSLALAGILGYVEAHPSKIATYQSLIEDYASFILAMKKQNGGFREYYLVDGKNQVETESPYFNGESLLALVRYYQFDPQPQVHTVIDDTFSQLKDREFDAPLYLWIMAALKDMYTLWPEEAYITYAKTYTDWRVRNVVPYRTTTKNYCAYTEGLASAYSILEKNVSERERLELKSELDFWNKKTSHLQLTESDTYRVLEKDASLTLAKLAEPTLAVGGFLTGESEPTLRIDFTQHCIGAYLQTLVDIEGKTL